MGCNIDFSKIDIGCQSVTAPKITYKFRYDKCYRNGKYYGKIIYKDDSSIMVKVENGNKYVQGQIVNFTYSEPLSNPEQNA